MSDTDERIKAAAESVYNQGFHDGGKAALQQLVAIMAKADRPMLDVVRWLQQAIREKGFDQGVNVDA
jgi:hypothetical protein